MQSLLRDIHHSFRVLAKNRSFTAVAVITLAFGIGASVAIFAVVRGVLLRPLPYRDPSRLVALYDANPERDANLSAFSPQDFGDFKRQQTSFDSLGGYLYTAGSSGRTLTGQGQPAFLEIAFAGDGFFETLGIPPVLGRSFHSDENIAGKDSVAILSDQLWRSHFHADPAVVGQKILVDGDPTIVVGVMPASFAFPARQVALWMPLSKITDDHIPHLRGLRWIAAVARLKPGITPQQASVASSVVLRRLEQQYPDSNTGWNRALAVDLHQDQVGDVKPALLALLTAGLLVLLMASVNLANLLLARGTVRQREFAIRSALGGNRWQLRRQVLTENIVLAFLGGVGAMLLAPSLAAMLLRFSAGSIPRADAVQIDTGVIAFAAGLTLLTGVLIGAIPALRLGSARVADSLKAIGTSVIGDARRQRGRDVLVVSEIALACAMLVASGLVLKSLWNLVVTDPGFDPNHVLTVQLSLPLYKLSDMPKQEAYRAELLRRVAEVPGVIAAGGGKTMPLHGGGEPYGFSVQESGRGVVPVAPTAGTYIVTPGYFQALKIPLVAGRFFTEKDFADHRGYVIINQQLARKFWPGQDAVGKFLHFGNSSTQKLEVLGVVGNVLNQGLTQESGTAVYMPESLAPRQKLNVFVRTEGDPLAVAGSIRRAIQDFEPDQPVNDIAPLHQVLQETIAQPRFLSGVLGAFGATALVLAAVGIFGVISYNVRQRTREIGVRMALGADRGDVLLLVLRQAALLIVIGLGAGLALATSSGRFMSSILFGVSPFDPLTLSAAVILLALVAALSALIPARRAAHIEPMVALRYE